MRAAPTPPMCTTTSTPLAPSTSQVIVLLLPSKCDTRKVKKLLWQGAQCDGNCFADVAMPQCANGAYATPLLYL